MPALLKSNLDCFKLFAQVSIVHRAHLWYKFTKHVMSKVRVAYNNVFRLYLYIEELEVAVPAKCLSTIIFITLKDV